MNVYKCLKKNIYELDSYSLVPLRERDIFLIMKWRNEQIDILRQKEPLTEEMQIRYYNEVIKPTFNEDYPKQILFSYLYNNECIGYGGLVHIDWYNKKGEVSFLIDTKRFKNYELYKKDFSNFLSIIKLIAFEEIKINRLSTETFDIRDNHIKILEMNGFIFEGRMRESILINNKFIDSLIHGFIRKDYYKNTNHTE